MHRPARRWLWRVGGAAGALFLLWLMLPASTSAPVRYEEVRRGDLVVELVESGEIRAVHAQTVAAPFEWRADLQIIDMVPEGSMVQKGDFLVQLDTGFLERELEDTQSQLESDLAELRRVTAEQKSRRGALQNALTTASLARDQAKLQLEKLRFESAARREEARLALEKAIIALEEARAKLAAQRILDSLETNKVQLKIDRGRGRVREVKRQIEALTLRAPLSGLVVYHERRRGGSSSKPKVGEKVNPGQAIIDIPDLSLMEVVFRVNEVDREKVREGLPAKVTLEAFPSRTFAATVDRIARLAERKSYNSQVKEFEVHATIEGTDPLLKPGMTAQVRMQLTTLQDTTLVPLTAVFEKDGRPVVFPKSRWPKPLPVKLVLRDDLFAAATDVEAGMLLATSPPSGAKGIHALGYAGYQRYLEIREREYQRHFQELERRGITFDYTTFREKGKAGLKPPASARESGPRIEGGTVVLPGGRRIQLPPGVAKKLGQGGNATLRMRVLGTDSTGASKSVIPGVGGKGRAVRSKEGNRMPIDSSKARGQQR